MAGMVGKKNTGLLLITQTLSLMRSCVDKMLELTAKHVSKRLYIAIDIKDRSQLKPQTVFDFIGYCYGNCHLNKSLDVRVLLQSLKYRNVGSIQIEQALKKVDIILLADCSESEAEQKFSYLEEHRENPSIMSLHSQLSKSSSTSSEKFPSVFVAGIKSNLPTITDNADFKKYSAVVEGGTFDRFHAGHKVMLSVGALMAEHRLTIGFSDGPLLENKLLTELIEPVQQRISKVRSFLEDIDVSLSYRLVPITDPFGPSIVEQDLGAIVASQETEDGARKVCEIRLERNLSKLDIYLIALTDDSDINLVLQEKKLSSSKERQKNLGELFRPRKFVILNGNPFVIGLTGGICSGKSHICKYLESLGASIIDCDKLGHLSYAAGTECNKKLVAAFGSDIVKDKESGEIDRRILGAKVFSDPVAMQTLNSLVWPEIKRQIQAQIESAANQGAQIIILDAAVLLDAGWDKLCHEVWVSVVPKKEALRRLCERNNITEAQAAERLAAQMTSRERVSRANVVFCSLWDFPITQAQVKKAWDRVVNDIKLSD